MKKRMLTLVLAVALVAALAIGLVACNNGGDAQEIELPAYEGIVADGFDNITIPADFKFGLICLHGESSTYDKNFIDAARAAAKSLGLSDSQLIIKTDIAETSDCETAATDLVNQGCKVIFADSFGHEKFIANVAAQHPEVQFCHGTGVTAHKAGLANFHNAFASIYEGRYLAGVVAGLKLKEMGYGEGGSKGINNPKVGYVGAFTYAEVISGYTSWFLGVRSIIPEATMEVQFTGSWFDVTAEKSAAAALIARNCVLISQHADSMGAPSACEEAGIPNVSYNGSTFESCPDTFLVSSRINWTPYFRYIIAKTIKNEAIDASWCGTLKTGSVALTNLGAAVAEGTKEYIIDLRTKLANGEIHVFDTSKFTVNGAPVTSHLVEEQEVIRDGYFHESEVYSAPYFDLNIDGITKLNEKV